MKLKYQEIENLPPLAWLADVSDGTAAVLHGSNVETKDTFFVEGAWAGEFSEGGFAESEWFCGTGGQLSSSGITFSTPSHMTSALFVSSDSGRILISNSHNFLCAYAGFQPDPQYLNYETDFNTILFGIHKYKSAIHLLNGTVSIYYFRTVHITDGGVMTVTLKEKSQCK